MCIGGGRVKIGRMGKEGGGGNKRQMENIESNMAPYPPPLAYIGPL